jgi:hypothetical protein
MAKSALYICYFGVREPLVQSQVVAYVRELAKAGWSMHLLTFEPGWPESFPEDERTARREALAQQGITWHAHPYTQSHGLAAKAKDIVTGMLKARRIARENKVQIVHGRAHVATTIALLSTLFLRPKPKILFDVRGFNPEEYVDAGRWTPGSLKFRLLKMAERWLLRRSSGFVVLTEAGRKIMFPKALPDTGPEAWRLPDGRPVQVIPCCVDMSRFDAVSATGRESAKAAQNLQGRPVIAYVGALGGWYLDDEMARIWAVARRMDPASFALIFTQSPPTGIREPLEAGGAVAGKDFHIEKVPPAELAVRLPAAEIALSIIKPSFSKIASSPTKLAEYLAAGCVVLSSRGIGDGDAQLVNHRVGVILDAFDDASIETALKQAFALAAEPDTPDRCSRTARELFDLNTVGGPRYRALYERMAGV